MRRRRRPQPVNATPRPSSGRDFGGDGFGRKPLPPRDGWRGAAGKLALMAGTALYLAQNAETARALPSFARQTGQECAACHVAFPELNEVGRRFKLGGYTKGGGDSRLPPLAVMLQPSFTHTEAGQPGGAAPHFGPNDNFALQEASLFYAGAITPHLGAFAQLTYDGVSRRFGWDNTDIRLADTGSIADTDIIYGLTLNNNPTVQDAWNTTPAWRFPFASPALAPAPAASALVEGGFAQKAVGLGAYAFWDNLVYAEMTGYRSLSTRTLTTLGTDSTDAGSIDGIAPYWRLAVEPHWGRHSWEVGTFGLYASLFPHRITSAGSDSLTDTGIDTQYQFNGERDQFGLQASWIDETRNWNASRKLGLTANDHDHLHSFRVKASYFYDHTIGINFGYFTTSGNTDSVLYPAGPITGSANGSPGSHGWIVELDYLPFMLGGPSFWPWLNARFALQYVNYDKFNGASTNYDGSGRDSYDNNTLFLLAWIAF